MLVSGELSVYSNDIFTEVDEDCVLVGGELSVYSNDTYLPRSMRIACW